MTFVNSKRVAGNFRGNYAIKAFAGVDTSDEELDAIWNRYFVAVNQYDHEIVDLRFELKDQLTREEWVAVFSGSQGMQN